MFLVVFLSSFPLAISFAGEVSVFSSVWPTSFVLKSLTDIFSAASSKSSSVEASTAPKSIRESFSLVLSGFVVVWVFVSCFPSGVLSPFIVSSLMAGVSPLGFESFVESDPSLFLLTVGEID